MGNLIIGKRNPIRFGASKLGILRVGLGALIVLGPQGLSGGGAGDGTWPQAADYTITNDNPSGAGSWAAAQAALPNGGIVHVEPSILYATVVNITARATAELIFRSPTPYGPRPKINRFDITDAKNITLRHLDIENDAWGTAADCVRYGGTLNENIWVDDCTPRGTYRGVRESVIDPNYEYPELACIYVTDNGSGGCVFSTTYNGRSGAFVGDLSNNATGLSLDCTELNAFGSGTAACTYDVVGGYITNVVTTVAGSGYASKLAQAASAMALTKVRNHAGVSLPRMVALLAGGFSSPGGTSSLGFLKITNCTFSQLNEAIKCVIPTGSTGYTLIEKNTFTKIYQDAISVSCGNNPGRLDVLRNRYSLFWGRSLDPGNPHNDTAQLRMNFPTGTTVNWKNCKVNYNVYWRGASRGSAQGPFISNAATGIYFEGWEIKGNMFAQRGNSAFEVSNAKDCYIWGNMHVLQNTADWATTASMAVGPNLAAGKNFVANNISEGVTSSNAGNVIRQNNITLTPHNAASYAATFVAPDTAPNSLAAFVAAYATLSGKNAGPLYNGYVDFINYTEDQTKEGPFAAWSNQTGLPVGTLVETGYGLYRGGPDAGAIVTPTAGTELKYADDDVGTNASAWFSTPTTVVPGKYLNARTTTSASLATTVSPSFTRNGLTFSVSFTTTSTAFAMVKNNNVGVVSRGTSLAAKTDVQKVMLAMRFRYATLSSTNVLMAGSNTSGRCEIFRSSASVMSVNVAATGSGLTASGNMRFNYTMDTNWHTLIAIYDTTQATKELGLRAWLDDTEVAYDDATTQFVTGTQASLATFASNPSIGGRHGLTGITDMECQWMALGWGDAADSILDMSGQLNRNKFLKDNLGANWSAPFAGMENWIAYTGDQTAAVFNSASIPNQNGGFSAVFGNRQAGWT